MNQDIEARRRHGTPILLAALGIWGLAVAVAAQTGFFSTIYPLLLAPLIALGIVGPVIVYALSKGFRLYIEALGLRVLTAFHIWRIGAALVFFWYGAQGLLPQTFVENAGWGDLVVGILALGVTLLPESRNRYLVFHILGFADFVVAVGTGLVFFLLAIRSWPASRPCPWH